MPRPISVTDPIRTGEATPAMRVVLVTMDSHLLSAVERTQREFARSLPTLTLSAHAASEWGEHPLALDRCVADIARADIVIVTMLFMEEHFRPVLDALQARRDHCDAMVCAMSAGEVTRLTRMGRFSMDGSSSSPAMTLLKKLREKVMKKEPGDSKSGGSSAGERQMKMLRRLPQLLRFVPGTAQDVRAYFLVLQYWLAGSQENISGLVRLLVERYADGPRRSLRALAHPQAPVEYPEVGLYHPRMQAPGTGRMGDALTLMPRVATSGTRGTVGILLLRSYLLAGNTSHYDGVITALEARGLKVLPCFASGLDARPAMERYFMRDGVSQVDAILSLTGFSLVGGPAYNDAPAAEAILARLDVPYLSVMPVEFQTLEQWGRSDRGLLPVESTIMMALPELDGCIAPMIFGGRTESTGQACDGCQRHCTFETSTGSHDMQSCSERADAIAARIGRLVDLKRSQRANRKIAAVIFNFPPNAGNTGTAAFLAVFESLFNTLVGLKAAGYTVELPESADALRESIIQGNAQQLGADANVHARIPANDHVKRERWLKAIEAQWGPAPGRQLSDGSSIFVLGERFGNVFVGVQPGPGYEGDPMRLLFERGFAPTHAFSAFYRWLREDFGADAVLHFGTHGSLEFMPGKQAGMSGDCWPDRLIGDLPNFYLYASNNPSEGTIAKRRANATLISYLTPPVSQAGVYKGLADLKDSIERYRGLEPDAGERAALAELVRTQAEALDLQLSPALRAAERAAAASGRPLDGDALVQALMLDVVELETALIPHGLHVVGRVPSDSQRAELIESVALATPAPEEADGRRWPDDDALRRELVSSILQGRSPEEALEDSGESSTEGRLAWLAELAHAHQLLLVDTELPGVLHALDGGYLRPAPGGDLLHNTKILPTGRNLHGFDPFRIPSAFAVQDGARQAERLLERHQADGHPFPESVALVLWGTDNLKSEGGPIAQALALMGARPRFDGYGRLAGAELVPLEQLGRPRVDVVITLSGIFRDLLPLQIKLLADAAFQAASADEPEALNFIRKHSLAHQREHACDLETAALRVFGNADGAYGANVGSLIDNGRWDDTDELAETYTRRKGFAYGRAGKPLQQPALLQSVLAGVQLAYQNLDSVELGVTTVDTYFDTLGGISRAVQRAKREAGGGQVAEVAPVYIGDQTHGEGTVRSLSEQVALETRTRMLNPKWYEGMLEHGYEGVRQIEVHLTNTLGWSATTGQVQPWVYQQLTQTFMLDPAMRERLARLNPTASVRVANRLLEAHERQYWHPDESVLEALRRAGEELEDRLEGVFVEKAAA